ncbi:polyketide synthase docking domain-containing protein, partial [Nonomuraea corallina]
MANEDKLRAYLKKVTVE